MPSVSQAEKPSQSYRPGASWQDKEEHVLPKNRLGIVFFGLMCSLFLAALDQTIVATALPTIVAQLDGGSQYSWVGSAYMLSAGAFGPLYGKLSNMFGRKPILYASICAFLLGSTLCGAAQSMIWLVVARAIQGVGSGGVFQLAVIIISDIVPLKDRGRYGGFVGATFAVASVMGPLLGGALTEHVSWRWCFFINLPTGGVAAAILFTFLNLNPHQRRPIRQQVAELDFVGLFSIVVGIVCLLLGFEFSQTSWSDAKTIALVVVGCSLLVLGGVNEVLTTRSAILPARLFKTRTTGILLMIAFIHAIAFYGASYYLPLYYQVLGATATSAGIRLIPFSIGTALTSIVAGLVNSRTGKYRPIIWCAYAVMTIGWGLMIQLDYNSNDAKKELYPLVAAMGVGCLFQIPIIAIQAAMPIKDMATASSAIIFLRSVGGAVGISVGGAMVSSILPAKLATVPGISSIGIGTSSAVLNSAAYKLHLIPDVPIRNAVLHAFSQSISAVWILNTGICGFGLILTLFLREYSMVRKIVRSGETDTSSHGETGGVSQSAEGQTGEEARDADAEMTRTNSIAMVGHEEKPEV